MYNETHKDTTTLFYTSAGENCAVASVQILASLFEDWVAGERSYNSSDVTYFEAL